MTNRLLLLPSLRLGVGPRGGHVLTKKFVEGMRLYVEHWPGPVILGIEPATEPDDNLDHAEWMPTELPFEVVELDFDDRDAIEAEMARSRLVAAGLDHRQSHLTAWAHRVGAKMVYTSEYTLRTRRQIVRAETPNLLLRWRRQFWAARRELDFLRAVRAADGLQCNGLPTYEVYRHLQPNTICFFDSRTTAPMLITDAELDAKVAALETGQPLRLGFSGRLNRMKGADMLVDVACALRRRGVPFTLDIWGGGALESEMAARIDSEGLGDQVRLGGNIDFGTELVPLVKRSIDLYVICHRQGDPSCTYLETLASGVPIVGVANEAWRGLATRGAFGWVEPMEAAEAVAARIESLDRDRLRLAAAMRAARAFAAEHTFEDTFARRLTHLRQTAGVD